MSLRNLTSADFFYQYEFFEVDVPGRLTAQRVPVAVRVPIYEGTSSTPVGTVWVPVRYPPIITAVSLPPLQLVPQTPKKKTKTPEFVLSQVKPPQPKKAPKELGARNSFQQMNRLPNYRGARTR